MARISKIAAFRLMFPQLYNQISNFFFPPPMGGACKTPGDQGGVGRHVQCLPNTLSETDHGHHHENCTCTCAEVEGLQQTSDSESQTACGHRLLQKRHQERRQRNELGHQMGDVAVWCVRVTTSWRHSRMSFPFHFCWCVSGKTFKGKPFASSDTEWK